MTDVEVEAWARQIIIRVGQNQPIEDAKVELKVAWIPAEQAARRLAAHANAVRSDELLWLVGVDEKAGTVPAHRPWT